MKTFILVGEYAVSCFYNKDWEELEVSIIKNYHGEIIEWDKETEKLSTLFDMLKGWNDFIELSKEDLEEIEQNTNIQIEWD